MSTPGALIEAPSLGAIPPGVVAGPPRSLLRRIAGRPVTLVSLIFVVGLVAACALAPWVAPSSAYTNDFNAVLSGPGLHHLLGTDELGRDTLSRILYGGRPTLLAAGEATAFAVVLGTALGVLSGYRRGWVDRVLAAWGDLLLAMPVLVVLIVVISVFPSSLYPTMIPLGVLLSAGPMRVVRSATLAVREELYIDAARVVGLPHRRIMSRHVVPRLWGPIVVQATLAAAVALVVASGLAFLGFGINPPTPSWGSMVADAATQFQRQAWLLVPSGGIITLTVLALGLLGDGITDLVDERWMGTRPRRGRIRLARPMEAAAAAAPGPTDLDGPADALLSVRGLSVGFDGDRVGPRRVVDGVSFDLRPGRTLSVAGESGCGKSMTARAILGVLPAGGHILGGSVRLGDLELAGAKGSLLRSVRGRRIGFIGQEPHASLDPTQTVGSALDEVSRRYDRSLNRRQARARVLDQLARVRLDDPARVALAYPHQLSGGMAQRVAIARALVGGPEILIADEPTTALDVTVQAEILALLRSLQETTGVAILLITHDWGVVASLADEVVVMYAGQVVERAAAEAVFARPLHPYTEALLRSDPHRAAAGGGLLPVIKGAVPAPGSWPSGCRFAPRCRYATAACQASPVVLDRPAPDRESRCIRIDALEGVG
ncbi:MAG: dipeptide/oligopeptide/nickel ABC transporter permease/ATP-binding protein [Acidimicrobiales bacterium]